MNDYSTGPSLNMEPALAWAFAYDTGEDDELFCVEHANDGGYILSGSTYHGNQLLVIKADVAGYRNGIEPIILGVPQK